MPQAASKRLDGKGCRKETKGGRMAMGSRFTSLSRALRRSPRQDGLHVRLPASKLGQAVHT